MNTYKVTVVNNKQARQFIVEADNSGQAKAKAVEALYADKVYAELIQRRAITRKW